MNKQQLANKIWASANKMRSKIEANEYKDYILGLIFYKFLSDNEVTYLHSVGWTDEDLPDLKEDYEDEDMAMMIEDCKTNIGYFIEYKNLFSTWLLPDTTFNVADLSVALNRFEGLISDNYKHIFEGIFITLQAGLSKLGESPAAQTKALKDLIKLIKDIPTDSKQDYDVLGYVYEYLIGNFAANAGKKAGEFYTPHEVAILMSEIVAEHHKNKDKIEIYDPTSGSGSLLITIGKSVGRHIDDKNKVKYYAQELKENTYNLTRMNLVMRGIKPSNIDTRCADSLGEDWPIQRDGIDAGKPLWVDAVVSNPPYSQHWDPSDAEYDARFKEFGTAPKSKADYAFLLHELHHLKGDGIMTIVLPHGVLFRGTPDDGAEGQIRKKLIEKNQIDAIIGLPANIFFGTGIPTLIMVLKQHRDRDDVLIIDASKGFVKDGKQNKLRASDIKRVADAWSSRENIEGFSRRVSREEIRANGYNLNIPRYVDSSEAPEQFDIYATMYGGVPNSEIDKLQKYWDVLPEFKKRIFKPIEGIPYSTLIDGDLKDIAKDSDDMLLYWRTFYDAFKGFSSYMSDLLIDHMMEVKEMQAHDQLATDIFHRMENVPIVDPYDIYQILSDHWPTIVNDIEVLQTEGLDAARTVEPATRMMKKGDEEIEVVDGMKGHVIPFDMVQERYFRLELRSIQEKERRIEEIAGEVNEIREDFTEEENQEYINEKEKLDTSKIKKDAKEKGDDIEPETKEKLKKLATLWDEKLKLEKALKAERKTLEEETIARIKVLTDEQIEQFLREKWITPVASKIMENVNNADFIISKVKALAEKYATSYHEIETQLSEAQNELSALISDITGDEYAIRGLNEFKNSLK